MSECVLGLVGATCAGSSVIWHTHSEPLRWMCPPRLTRCIACVLAVVWCDSVLQPGKSAWAMTKDCALAWTGAVDTALDECRETDSECVMFDSNREKCGEYSLLGWQPTGLVVAFWRVWYLLIVLVDTVPSDCDEPTSCLGWVVSPQVARARPLHPPR